MLRRPPFFTQRAGPPGFQRRPGFGPRQGFVPVIKRPDLDRGFRERPRMIRDDRRNDNLMKIREIDRKQREEKERIEREKEKLRIERERLEREKAEMLKFQREKQKAEREQIFKEREELRRRQQQMSAVRIDESRSRASINSSVSKRPYEGRDFRGNEGYWDERKRLQSTQRVESQIIPGRSFAESSATR